MAIDFNSAQHLAWERSCLARIGDGDRKALGELYERFADTLYRQVLMPKLGQKHAAEDALSETFRAVIEKLPKFRHQGTSVYFWMARIAANKAMDMHRARAVSGRALANLEAQVPTVASDPSPDQVLQFKAEWQRAQDRVNRCLVALNPRYRRVIELRFLKELPREQCAEQMEVKLGTLDVLVLRALKAFRKEWDREAELVPDSVRLERVNG